MSTILRLRIISILRKFNYLHSSAEVPQGVIYSHPTITSLTDYIIDLVNHKATDTISPTASQCCLINEMIAKYSHGLETPVAQARAPHSPHEATEHHCVLLTGSTGNLGAELLSSLLMKTCVQRVYVLNRTSKYRATIDRHRERFDDRGLDLSLLQSPKLVLLEGDISQHNLDLPIDVFDKVLTPLFHQFS